MFNWRFLWYELGHCFISFVKRCFMQWISFFCLFFKHCLRLFVFLIYWPPPNVFVVTLVEWCTWFKQLFASSWWIHLEETELLIRRSRKEDSNAIIHRVWIKSLLKSHFSISLCCLRCLPLVRPINEVDVAQLENEFVMGYRDGDRALYVSPFNNLNKVLHVSDDIQNSWSWLWKEANEEFDAMLQNDPVLEHLSSKMFYVWEGNHHLTAWWRHISKHHSLDKDWHIFVDCIVVDPRNSTAVFLNAMNDINW